MRQWWKNGVVILCFLSVASAVAQLSPFTVIPFQGVLTTNGGVVVPDGNYQLTFRLYPAASGGSAVWNETQTVSVSNGSFSVLLGSQNSFGNLRFDRRYYLGISIGGGSELEPRIPIGAVAYSIRSRWVEEVTSGNIGSVVVAGEGIGIDQSSTAVTIRALVGEAIWNAGQLRGRLVSGAAPQAGQVLKWDGARWAPGDAGGSGGAVGGDLSGVVTNATVIALRGRPISNVAPYPGQALRWDGSQWVPGSVGEWSVTGNTLGGGEYIGALNATPVVIGVAAHRVFYWDPNLQIRRSKKAAGNHMGSVDFQMVFASGGDSLLSGYAVRRGGQLHKGVADYGVIGGGKQSDGVSQYSVVMGGIRNEASSNPKSVAFGGAYNTSRDMYVTILGGDANDGIDGNYGVILGGHDNDLLQDNSYVSIAGGYNAEAGYSADYATVLGGRSANVSDYSAYSAVAGGAFTSAGGNYRDYAFTGGGAWTDSPGMYATAVGGFSTTAGGFGASRAFVGGGRYAEATDYFSACGGGSSTIADGEYAAVVGGSYAKVYAPFSFAGVRGKVNSSDDGSVTINAGYSETGGKFEALLGGDYHTGKGDYVWIYGYDIDPLNQEHYRVYLFSPNYSGSLILNRLDGNYPIYVGTHLDTLNGGGAHLTPGGVWTNASSRFKKDRFQKLDGNQILQKIQQLKITAWYYAGTQERHIGPIAEQFAELFGTGVLNDPSSRHYLSTIDPAGVALVGVQTLYQRLQSIERQLQEIEHIIDFAK